VLYIAIVKRAIAFLALAVAVAPAFAQERAKEASPLRIEEPIAVDGALGEPAWHRAGEPADFIQFQPNRGEPASVRTVVKVLYDSRVVYFGFH